MFSAKKKFVSIEEPCSPASGIYASLRQAAGFFDCKVLDLILDSLANPAAHAAGFPLRSNKLRGMRSLLQFKPS